MPDNLALLRQLRAEVGRIAERLDREIAAQENRIAETRVHERRRTLKLVAIPLGIGMVAAAAARAWVSRNAQTIAVAGGSAAVTGTAVAAVFVPQIGPAPDRPDAISRPPSITAPPAGRISPPAPAKTHPSTPPPQPPTTRPLTAGPAAPPPSPTPSPTLPGVSVKTHPPHPVKTPPVDLTHPVHPPHPPHPPDADGPHCLVDILGLLCGRVAR